MRAARGLTVTALLVGLTWTRGAHAFKPIGHDVIEATAYRHLLAMSEVPGMGISGKALLATLINRHVLAKPTCFASVDDACGPNVSDIPGQWLPVVRSGSEDLWLARQFSGSEQCYHFMAPPSDVYDSDAEDAGIPDRMVRSAPPRCLRFVNGLVDAVEPANPDGAYVLIHALVDSYSGAHADRADGTWHLDYLKPWRLTGAPEYVFHPSGFAYWDARFQHEVVDPADDAWLADAPTCVTPNDDAVYTVVDDCLTPRAREAADVVVQALEALYTMTGPGRRPSHAAAEWVAILDRVAGAPTNEAERQGPAAAERIWSPDVLLGAALGTFTRVRHTEAMARFGWIIPNVPWFAPLVPSAFAEVGAAHGTISGLVFRANLVGFELPLTQSVSLEMPALGLEVLDKTVDVVTTIGGLDLFPVSGLWVGVTAGHYSFAAGAIDAAPTMTLGGAIGESRDVGQLLPSERARATKRLTASNATADQWRTPSPPFSAPRPRVRYWYQYLGEYDFNGRGGSAGLLGQEILWAAVQTRGDPVLGFGLHGLVGGMRVDDTTYAFARLSGAVRWWALGAFSLESQPIGVVGGVPAQGEAFAAAVIAPLSAVLSAGDLDVVVDGPTGEANDYGDWFAGRGFRPAHGSVVGLRIGTDVHR